MYRVSPLFDVREVLGGAPFIVVEMHISILCADGYTVASEVCKTCGSSPTGIERQGNDLIEGLLVEREELPCASASKELILFSPKMV